VRVESNGRQACLGLPGTSCLGVSVTGQTMSNRHEAGQPTSDKASEDAHSEAVRSGGGPEARIANSARDAANLAMSFSLNDEAGLNGLALSSQHCNSKPFRFELAKRLTQSSGADQLKAAFMLLYPNRSDRAAETVLLTALHSDDPELLKQAASLLFFLDQTPRRAKGRLEALLTDSRPDVRVAAAAALREGPIAITILTDGMRSSNLWAKSLAAAAFARLGMHAKSTIAVLKETLNAADPRLQCRVVYMITRIVATLKCLGSA